MDEANFRKRHYHDRAKILNMHGEAQFINLPIGQNHKFPLNKINITDVSFEKKLLRSVRFSYAKAKYFDEIFPNLERLLLECRSKNNLADFNSELIVKISKWLNLNHCKFMYQSDFAIEGDRTLALIEICRQTGDLELLVGKGKSQSVHDMEKIVKSGISVFELGFGDKLPFYEQYRRSRDGFMPGLSIIDVLFNAGIKDAKSMLKSMEPKRLEF